MRQDEIWDVDAARRYDTPGTGMFAPEVLGPTVDRLAELAGDGRALEFAIGTGRVAVPLSERGVPVTGIELSAPDDRPAAHQGRRGHDPGGRRRHGHRAGAGRVHAGLPRLQHDLEPADPGRAGRLLPQRGAAPHARRPFRHRAVGAGAAQAAAGAAGHGLARPSPATSVLDTYDVLQQHVVSHHFRFGEGTQAQLFRSPHRYVWPAELDLMAQLAGFELESRHADWAGAGVHRGVAVARVGLPAAGRLVGALLLSLIRLCPCLRDGGPRRCARGRRRRLTVTTE